MTLLWDMISLLLALTFPTSSAALGYWSPRMTTLLFTYMAGTILPRLRVRRGITDDDAIFVALMQ